MMAIQVPPLIHSKVKIQQCACHTRCETLVTLADVKINESCIECNLQSVTWRVLVEPIQGDLIRWRRWRRRGRNRLRKASLKTWHLS